jgi:hypothetical protein
VTLTGPAFDEHLVTPRYCLAEICYCQHIDLSANLCGQGGDIAPQQASILIPDSIRQQLVLKKHKTKHYNKFIDK